MNRRNLLQSIGIFPVAFSGSIGIRLQTVDERFAMQGYAPAQMLLRAYTNSEAAETWRQDWAGRAFTGQGEWYLDSSEDIELAPALAEMPGSVKLHRYTAGVAAVKSALLVGAFRREHIACVFRIKGNDEPAMIMLAEFFAGVSLPEPWELAWSDAQLQAFIPTTESLGIPVVPNEQFWP